VINICTNYLTVTVYAKLKTRLAAIPLFMYRRDLQLWYKSAQF